MAEVVLAARADGGGVYATDLHSGALLATFEGSGLSPHAFATIGASSSYFFAAEAKKALWHAWAWGDKQPCYRATFPEKMTAVAFTASGELCFAGSISGYIYAWQLGTGCLVQHWPAHFREVTQLLIAEDEVFLVSSSADSVVHLYNLVDVFAEKTPAPLWTWSGHSLSVTSMALLPGSGLQRTVVTASLDRTVRLWDVASGRAVSSRVYAAPVHFVAASRGAGEVLSALANGELRGFDPSCRPREENDHVYSGHMGPVLGCAMNEDGSRAVSCSSVDQVRVWETRTRQCVAQVHNSRNAAIGGVHIAQRFARSHSLPAFQPLQRVMADFREAPPVPLSLSGQGALLERMRLAAASSDFVEDLEWDSACCEGLSRGRSVMQEELAAARAKEDHWRAVACELYRVAKAARISGLTTGAHKVEH